MTYLITGGSGSFGQTMTKFLLEKDDTHKVIIYSRDEYKQWMMRNSGLTDDRIRYYIGDVRDKDRLMRACESVDVLIHAAALKQVGACETNPMEAIKTNIHGSENIVEVALDLHIPKVIALSTDKAVNPINLYGATKMILEKIILAGNTYSWGDTKFSCVRYGNIIGSRGSIIEYIQDNPQLENISLTDPDMTRFFWHIEEACQLVYDCIQLMQGDEIFIPALKSWYIEDIITEIGKTPIITGIRPGEKLRETMRAEHEVVKKHPSGMHIITKNKTWDDLPVAWTELDSTIEANKHRDARKSEVEKYIFRSEK